jgi:membrane peptidoglycan carboxypeptidase
VAEHIDPTHDIGVAIATTEPGTGAVRAIALNRDWGEGRGRTTLNYALDQVQGGSRGFQAGSTFKPFVLAAAAQKGIEADLDLNSPSEATFSGFRHCETNRRLPSYDVGNYDGEGFGTIDMREATARSVNTYFVQLAERIGTCRPPQVAEDLGVRRADGRPLSRVPAFALGVDEVSPLRMAEAYATFAADGLHCPSHAIVEIATREGATLPLPERRCVQALTKQEAATVTGLLERVIDGPDDERTGAKMSLGLRPAAGKTGTTDNAQAVWFTGYTRQLAAAVWAGYPDENRALKKVRIRGEYFKTLFGGALPGPIWREAMKAAHEGVEIERLERELPDCTDPEGDVERARCPDDLEGKGKRDGDDRDDTNDEDDEDD